MSLIQILQQNLLIQLLPLILTHILAPTPYRTRQPPRYVRLVANLRDGLKVGADGEDDAAGFGEATQGLPFGAEVVVFDCYVLFGGEPAAFLGAAVFGSDGGGPGEGVVDLEEVVVLFVS